MTAYANHPGVTFKDHHIEAAGRDGTWHVAPHPGPGNFWVAIPPIDESDDQGTWREVVPEFPLTEESLGLYGGAIGRQPRFPTMDSAIRATGVGGP